LLEQDVKTANIALADADGQLESIGDPALIPIREKISAEKIALAAVQFPDYIGLSLRLANLVQSIGDLPLISNKRKFTVKTNTETAHRVDDWRQIPQAMWKDIKELVIVRRNDTPIEPLLPPNEQHYLAQNLGLKLEQSRVALLRRDTQLYRSNLEHTRSWIDQYFSKDDIAVSNVIETVDEMLAIDLKPSLPDISGSLRALRLWLQNNNLKQTVNMKHGQEVVSLQTSGSKLPQAVRSRY